MGGDMITFLDGKLEEALPMQIAVNVGGVGYQVFIPLSSFDRLPSVGGAIRVLTHLVVREDAHILYGFMSAAERDLFRLLTGNVSGVGPKLALAVLSGMAVEDFKTMVVAGDVAALARVRGVGKKTAERMVLELKDKLGVAAEWEASSAKNAPTPQDRAIHDAALALISLGYKQVDAHKAIKRVIEIEGPGGSGGGAVDSEALVRQALKLLLGASRGTSCGGWSACGRSCRRGGFFTRRRGGCRRGRSGFPKSSRMSWTSWATGWRSSCGRATTCIG
jgi:Holliday junction DNA helicase RuvA